MEAESGVQATRARPQSAGVPVPPPLIYVTGFLLGLALELAVPIARPPLALGLPVAALGVAVWLALDGAAMLHFRGARTSMVPTRPATALVTSGPYRFSRNPMYVGMAFLYAGLAVPLGVIWALALLPAVLLAVQRIAIAREERYLESEFGERYRAYKRRVRRWL